MVQEYANGMGGEPSLGVIKFDVATAGTSSMWNMKIFDLLARDIRASYSSRLPAAATHQRLVDFFFRKYKILWDIYKKTRMKRHSDGSVETPEQYAQRLLSDSEKTHGYARRRERRASKYKRRLAAVEHLEIQVSSGTERSRHQLYRWMASVLQKLAVEGMSSECSDANDSSKYRVSMMSWRSCDIDNLLYFLDGQHTRSNAGSAGKMRVHDQRISSRAPPQNLPRKFFEQEWLQEVEKEGRMLLRVSEEDFEWMDERWLVMPTREANCPGNLEHVEGE